MDEKVKEALKTIQQWFAEDEKGRSVVLFVREGEDVITGFMGDNEAISGMFYSGLRGKFGDSLLGCIDKAVTAYLDNKKKHLFPIKSNKYKS